MICVRCGFCCTTYMVVIIDDPSLGPVENNLRGIGFNGPERCPHLVGDEPGSYSCAVHDQPWYPETPCASYGQIEHSEDKPCRIGTHILSKR